MKKNIAILLIMTITLIFVGCGQDNSKKVDDVDTSEVNEKNNDHLKAENTEGKTKLTLACFVLTPNIEEKIIDFNKTNEKYYIEVMDYSQYKTKDDSSAGETKLNTDIIAGNTPDIIELGKTPLERYSNKGLLEDLNNFLSKDDQLNKDSFVKGAYNALLTDGKLYRVAPSFSVTSLYGKTSKIGESNGWNFSELQSFLEKNSNVENPFINMNSQIFHCLVMYNMEEFVDRKNGTCNFNSEDFISILETAKKYSGIGDNSYRETNEELLADTGLLATMYSANIDVFARNDSALNGDMNMIGFPTEDGSGNVAEFQFSFGIFSDSENKEGAWEFLKTYFEDDYQNRVMDIPTKSTAFDNTLEKSEATDEQKQKFKDIINSVTKSSFFDGTLMGMLIEETEDYFDGDRTAKETADNIQSRASIYISENR